MMVVHWACGEGIVLVFVGGELWDRVALRIFGGVLVCVLRLCLKNGIMCLLL